jgi:hypothetical protein
MTRFDYNALICVNLLAGIRYCADGLSLGAVHVAPFPKDKLELGVIVYSCVPTVYAWNSGRNISHTFESLKTSSL